MTSQIGSITVTRGIRIEASPRYLPDHSKPDEANFVFAYTIRIKNESPETVRVLWRHWNITDANGQTKEVQGRGVVGEQPVLTPGDAFEYQSFCPLTTPTGAMEGHLTLERADKSMFEAYIDRFELNSEPADND